MSEANLPGWHVVEAGVRQAWPFLTFADPDSSRETRLYIDAAYEVSPALVQPGDQDDDALLGALLTLNMQSVVATTITDDFLTIQFDSGDTLRVSSSPNAKTTGDVWWLSPPTS